MPVPRQLLQRCKALVVKYSSPWLFQKKQGRIKSAMGKEERLQGHAASVPGNRGCEVCQEWLRGGG